ncbi:hypothetical protein SOVF_148750, partial [Spinacia oleracea]
VYKESRKRVPGRTYLTNPEKIEENIEKIDALESTQDGEGGSNSEDLISEVIQGPKRKRKSRVPLYGKGVTKSDLKKMGKKIRILDSVRVLAEYENRVGASTCTPRCVYDCISTSRS